MPGIHGCGARRWRRIDFHGHTHVAGLGGLAKRRSSACPSASRSGLGTGSLPPTISIESVAVERDWKIAVENSRLSGDQGRFAPTGGSELTIPALRH